MPALTCASPPINPGPKPSAPGSPPASIATDEKAERPTPNAQRPTPNGRLRTRNPVAMSFLNPWLLGGIAGIASPIIIHLLAKKRVLRVVWAAMRFLRVTVDRQQRKMTLEDIILLI